MNIDYRFSVAPMMGYTTPHGRYLYRLMSKKAVLFTEMEASKALLNGNRNKLLFKNEKENPIILQVGGSDDYELSASSELAEKLGFDGINLNYLSIDEINHFFIRMLNIAKWEVGATGFPKVDIFDEDDLIIALSTNIIAGAGIDVYEKEPLPSDHKLRFLPNALLLPHLGYVTAENYSIFYTQMLENLEACVKGKPVRVINND